MLAPAVTAALQIYHHVDFHAQEVWGIAVKASAVNRREPQCHSSSSRRRTAGALGFFTFTQQSARPER